MKCCLLYCCLYPEDYNIPKRRLVEYWFCEGLLNEYDRISEAEMQGDRIINSLLRACLLERGEEECVKMQDVIRDMGLWLACELEAHGDKFFVKAGAQLVKVQGFKAWEGAKRTSLMKNQIEVIGNDFFRFIPHLTVLDLSENIDLKALPEGISQLISLECLDLSGTGIIKLPIELKSFTKLKMLDLRNMINLIEIPQDLISSFSELQIFRIDGFLTGDYPEEDFPEEDNVLDGNDNEKLIEELKCLQQLNILRVPPIRSMSALQRFLSLHSFRRCTEALDLRGFRETKVFSVSCLENMERLKILFIQSCGKLGDIRMGKELTYASRFQQLREVDIFYCNKLRDVTWLILAPNLTCLRLRWCGRMEQVLSKGKLAEVADLVGTPYPTPFLNLRYLFLRNLTELKSIYWDALRFACLKSITINNCPKLKKLPLDSESAKGNNITIEVEQDWWAQLEWENEATRHAFLPSFQDSKF
ncbi:hypothetical protein V6N11_047640 [Hibiscus sabdariffa]|uniref:Disease resistance protein n=1 Tax=Hibiscus sabdariffa TaxID=183260 RepID=A0ABR2NL23_9ROSI